MSDWAGMLLRMPVKAGRVSLDYPTPSTWICFWAIFIWALLRAGARAVYVSFAQVLAGESGGKGVLEALDPTARAEAMGALRDAMADDADHGPTLRAVVALSSVSGRWPEVVTCLERLVEAPGEPGGRAWHCDSARARGRAGSVQTNVLTTATVASQASAHARHST